MIPDPTAWRELSVAEKIIEFLDENESIPHTIPELAAAIGCCEKATFTALKKLETKGIIERKRYPANYRGDVDFRVRRLW